ncbi:MAG: hypothetical protein R3C15_13080 [Thermoleophilia bacterium]
MKARALALALVTGVGLVAAPAALAKDGDVRVKGSCTASSTAKLKLSDEDGRIEVEFEVDQNRNGVRWNVKLMRGGKQLASTSATTRAPSGSFTVRRVVSNAAGRDTIKAIAKRNGETCTATATATF